MSKTFLGKTSRKQTTPQPVRRLPKRSKMLFILVPALLLSAVVYALTVLLPSPARLQEISQNTLNAAGTRVLADDAPNNNADGHLTQYQLDPCSQAALAAENVDVVSVFPLLPSGIMPTPALTGTVDPAAPPAVVCTPPYWNIFIIEVFLYKGLAILNYAAGAFAVIFTVYAGLLYLTGVASEANVKTAKGILVATYVGLIIVILARVIVYGPILQLNSSQTVIDPTTILGKPNQ